MSWNISRDPLSSGSAGMNAARPSVMELNLCCSFFTLVAAPRQPQTRIGFPSGQRGGVHKTLEFKRFARLATSTESGFSLKAVNDPDTGYRPRSGVYVTQFLPLVRKLSSLALFIPSAGGVMPRPFFISFGIDEVTRS